MIVEALLAAAATKPAFTLTTDPFLDLVTFLLVGGTVALAVYTGRLHGATVGLAKDTVQGTEVADRHHQETLSPICVIAAVQSQESGGRLKVRVLVSNVGSGPALDVSVSLVATDGSVIDSEEYGAGWAPMPPASQSDWLDLGEFSEPADDLRVRVSFSNQFGGEGFAEFVIDTSSPKITREKLQLCQPQKRPLS